MQHYLAPIIPAEFEDLSLIMGQVKTMRRIALNSGVDFNWFTLKKRLPLNCNAYLYFPQSFIFWANFTATAHRKE